MRSVVIVFALVSAKGKGILENYYIFSCEANIYYHIFVIFTIIYKLVLHAVALVLSFLTRNIKVDILNDYRHNTVIIVASSLLMLAVIISTLLFSDYHLRFDIVWAIIVFLANSVYLGLTFIPKVCIAKRGIIMSNSLPTSIIET